MDNRNSKRGPTGIIVRYRVNGPDGVLKYFGFADREGIAHDLSTGGLSLYTDYDLPRGTAILLMFRLSDRTKPASSEEGSRKMELYGEVRHSSVADGRASYLAGVRFTKLSDADRAFIAACV